MWLLTHSCRRRNQQLKCMINHQAKLVELEQREIITKMNFWRYIIQKEVTNWVCLASKLCLSFSWGLVLIKTETKKTKLRASARLESHRTKIQVNIPFVFSVM